MKLALLKTQTGPLPAVLSAAGEHYYPFAAAGVDSPDLLHYIKTRTPQQQAALAALSRRPAAEVPGAVPAAQAALDAPIPNPEQDIICLGVNYLDHAAEAAAVNKAEFAHKAAGYPVYFAKRCARATAPGGGIPAHQDLVDSLDYEAELAVILGQDADHVSTEQAAQCVFGYTVLNDVSARSVQTNYHQWFFGKSLDGFCPMGPCIVTADSVPYPPELEIGCTVNGEVRQHSNTRLLIYSISHTISELSRGMVLRAGTVLSMGTPAGVGMGFTPPRWLNPGDRVCCTVEGIGTLENTVVE